MSKKTKKGKYAFFDTNGVDEFEKAKIKLINKFYALWMNKFIWSGLDEEIKEQQQEYIMRKLYANGTVACWKIKNTETLGFAPYTVQTYNMYDQPDTIQLINLRGVSTKIIPTTPMTIGKDVEIIWANTNHKPIAETISYYAERIAQVDCVINTNLQLHKMPFLVAVDPIDAKKMEDVVSAILNNELVVYTELDTIQAIQALKTEVPYIIDKLVAYKAVLENEILTFLGIDNTGSIEKSGALLTDEVNATNQVINCMGATTEDEIQRGLDRANRTFSRSLSIESVNEEVDSEYESDRIDNDNAAGQRGREDYNEGESTND